MSWLDVGSLDDIPVRGARLLKTKLGCVALFRTGNNDVFAVDDRCPHKGGPLSEGIVHGTSVTCPLHNWVFSLETGISESTDEGQIATYPVRVANGRLEIEISRLSGEKAA